MAAGSTALMLAIAAPTLSAQGEWGEAHHGSRCGEQRRHDDGERWRGEREDRDERGERRDRGERGERRGGCVLVRMGAFGGADFPVGSTGRGLDAGWTTGALLEVRPRRAPMGIRFDASYQRFTPAGATSVGSLQLWGGDVNLLFTVPGPLPARPYLTAGVGLYGTKSSIPATGVVAPTPTTTKSGARFALNGGVGLQTGIGPVGAFVEGRYLYIFTRGTRTKVVPVVFGITIGD